MIYIFKQNIYIFFSIQFLSIQNFFLYFQPLPSNVFKKRAGEMEIDTQIVAINPIPPQDSALPHREEKEPVHAEHKKNEVEEQECKLREHDMKALVDLLEAIGEN